MRLHPSDIQRPFFPLRKWIHAARLMRRIPDRMAGAVAAVPGLQLKEQTGKTMGTLQDVPIQDPSVQGAVMRVLIPGKSYTRNL